jgi:hypothetical protein
VTADQKIKDVAFAVAMHFRARLIGNTTAMINGLVNPQSDLLVVFRNKQQEILLDPEPFFESGHRLHALGLDGLPEKLRGVRTPLLVDHDAMATVLFGLLAEIHKLESEIASSKTDPQL